MRGRKKIPEDEKKERVVIFIKKKIIDSLGIERVVENSISSNDKEYQKKLKSGS